MTTIQLRASDGHSLDAYEAHTDGASAAVVVIQEVFGVNAHIRSVVDCYAELGYHAIAPAVFDRAERGVELPYTDDGVNTGRALRESLEWDVTVECDIGAAVDYVSETGPVGVVGYCYGGSLAWLCASWLGDRIAAGVGYYGGQVHQFRDQVPAVPTMLHFGELDPLIPLADVEVVAAERPEAIVHVYEGADHGFNCDDRSSYDKAAADLALYRTLDFLRANGVA